MPVIGRVPVKRQRTCIDIVAQLLSNIGLMGFIVDAITAAAIIGCMMVFGSDLAVVACFDEQARSGCGSSQLGNLAKTIQVAVVRATRAVTGKQIGTDIPVLG